MSFDRSKGLIVALLMVLSGFTAIVLVGPQMGSSAPVEPYHNSYIHFDVDMYDGAPADGFSVIWST